MLPITSYREQITSAVLNHYVTIITAETGAGKYLSGTQSDKLHVFI